jgi:hypothetical protein
VKSAGSSWVGDTGCACGVWSTEAGSLLDSDIGRIWAVWTYMEWFVCPGT